MESKILGYAFLGAGKICLVVVETEYDGEKAYIGVPRIMGASDEDIRWTADWRSFIPLEEAKLLISKMGTYL